MQRLNHEYIYTADFRYHISFFSPSSFTRFDKEDSDGAREEGGREWKRDEKETDSERGGRLDRDAKRDREKNIYIEVVVVVVLLVDFPFSYSI